VAALRGADLALDAGEVHALLGENGAGKSTLVRILAGLETRDHGTIRLDGAELALRGPRDAHAAGIAVVHQHDALIASFTVAENFELALASGRSILSPRAMQVRAAAEFAALVALGLELPDPKAYVRDLGIAQRCRLEIARALATQPRVLVLDEPTAALAPHEADRLLDALTGVARRGVAVLIVTHHLREVERSAAVATILRRGRTVARLALAGGRLDRQEVAALMVGDDFEPALATAAERPDRRVESPAAPRPVVAVRDLASGELDRLHGVTFTVAEGEVVAVVGVAGNGQRALLAALAGTGRATGSFALDGRRMDGEGVATRRAAGLAIVPEDRRSEGLALDLPIGENLLLSTRALAAAGCTRWLSRSRVAALAAEAYRRFGVRGAPPDAPAAALSGGNQQRVVLARELGIPPRALLLGQPTRGLDVRGVAFVRARIRELAATRCATLLITTDLDEALALADRVLVLFRGRIVGEFDAGDAADVTSISRAMVGAAT
jgi:ABC-type uncharacterized transport system ATPase subunit